MERVETLISRLQEQIKSNTSVDQMLLTVQMIQSELLHLKRISPKQPESSGLNVNIPSIYPGSVSKEKEPEEKIVEVLQIDEAEVEAELEEIKRNAETRIQMSSQNKPHIQFDPLEDTPTLIHQKPKPAAPVEIPTARQAPTDQDLNERLKQSRVELSDALQETAIKDLRKGIGLNDRFLFINELFRGDEVMYERSIKTINSFAIFPEAEYWIKRELKLKLGWAENNAVVKQFDQLVKRRFS